MMRDRRSMRSEGGHRMVELTLCEKKLERARNTEDKETRPAVGVQKSNRTCWMFGAMSCRITSQNVKAHDTSKYTEKYVGKRGTNCNDMRRNQQCHQHPNICSCTVTRLAFKDFGNSTLRHKTQKRFFTPDTYPVSRQSCPLFSGRRLTTTQRLFTDA